MNGIEMRSSELLDIFCRVESGNITETQIDFVSDGVKKSRYITEQDIVDRGHPFDWYVRATRIYSVLIPKYHRKTIRFSLVRLPDTTVTAEVTESVSLPTLSSLLLDFSKGNVTKWSELPDPGRVLLTNMLTASIEGSLKRFCHARRYISIDSATRMIGCHIPKYDAEGRRVQYLYAETWAKFEWYMDQLKADLVPFPTKATDILQHFPRLTWSDTDSEAAVSDSAASGDTDTADTPSV